MSAPAPGRGYHDDMGYTHYFAYRPQDPQWAHSWPTLLGNAREITAAAEDQGYALVGGLGDVRPEIGPERIWLNGEGDGSHETFYLAGPRLAEAELENSHKDGYVFGFCKTARNEYDGVVCALLLRAAQVAPESMLIGSDGDFDIEWEDGAGEGLAARPLLRSIFGTDHLPDAAHEYFTTGADAGEIFARIDRERQLERAGAQGVEATPLADHLFRDEPGLGF